MTSGGAAESRVAQRTRGHRRRLPRRQFTPKGFHIRAQGAQPPWVAVVAPPVPRGSIIVNPIHTARPIPTHTLSTTSEFFLERRGPMVFFLICEYIFNASTWPG